MSNQATVLASQEHPNTLKLLPQLEVVEDGGAKFKRFTPNAHLCPSNNSSSIKASLRTLACQSESNGGSTNGGRTVGQNNQTSAIRYNTKNNSKTSSTGGGSDGIGSASQSAGGYQLQYREELNKKRERLFRLLSKVPIQVETVSSLMPKAQQQSAMGGTSVGSTAAHTNKVIDKEPLLIKYYSERSLAEIIQLHFSCSLVKHNYERGLALDAHLDRQASTAVAPTTFGPQQHEQQQQQQRYAVNSYQHHAQASQSTEQSQPSHHHHQLLQQPHLIHPEPVSQAAYNSLADNHHQVYGSHQQQPAYSHQQPTYTDWRASTILPSAPISFSWHQQYDGLHCQQEVHEKELAAAATIAELGCGGSAGETTVKSALLSHQASQQRRTSSATLAIKESKQSAAAAATAQESAGQRQAVGPLKTRQRRQNQNSNRQPHQATNGNITNHSSPSNQNASSRGSQMAATNFMSMTTYDQQPRQQVSRDEQKAKYHHLDGMMSIANASSTAQFNCDASYSASVSELSSSEPSTDAASARNACTSAIQLQHDSLEAFTPVMGIQEAIACDQHQQHSQQHDAHLHHQLDQPQYTAADLYLYTSAAYAPSHPHQLQAFEMGANQHQAQHQHYLIEQSVAPMSFCGQQANSSFCHQQQVVAYSSASSSASSGGASNNGALMDRAGHEFHLQAESSCSLHLAPPPQAVYYNQPPTGAIDYAQATTMQTSSHDGLCYKGWQVCGQVDGAPNATAASQVGADGDGNDCTAGTQEPQQQMIEHRANGNLSESYERGRGFFRLASGTNYTVVYATDSGECQQTALAPRPTGSLAPATTPATATTTATSQSPPNGSAELSRLAGGEPRPAFGGLDRRQDGGQQQQQQPQPNHLTDRPVLQ